MHTKRVVLCAIVALLVAALPVPAQTKKLSIDDIFDPARRVNFTGTVPSITWMPDGASYLLRNAPASTEQGILLVDAVSGSSRPFLDVARMTKAIGELPGVSAGDAASVAGQRWFTYHAETSTIVSELGDDLIVYNVTAGKAMRLTSAPGEETNASFSPNGKFVAYVRDGDLYCADVASQRERRLTTDGGPNRLNGRLDWVYEEELYGRGETTGYWWSPDSLSIAFLSFDETPVPFYAIVDDAKPDQGVEMTRYPRAGDPNPIVTLGVVPAFGGPTQWMDLSWWEAPDRLVSRVDWSPDSRNVVYQVQDRVQSRLELVAADRDSGVARKLFREESKYWIDVIGNPHWLPDGSFLWLSDRTGFRHVYHYAADGKLNRAITSGSWDIRELYGAAADGWVYFQGAEHSPLENHIYRVRLDGTGMARLTDTAGDHSASFNSKMTMFVDSTSDIRTPPQVSLRSNSGAVLRTIEKNTVAALKEYALGEISFHQVKTRDGVTMDAAMIKPPDFDPKQKYPVMSFCYAGPGAQSVRNRWGRTTIMWYHLLAQNGYVIWVCDNRSASARGVVSQQGVFRNFGVQEMSDLEDGAAWLKAQSFVDGSRIGLWGWSYGGFMASFALTHSTTFKIGVAGAPVTDWRLYDSIYTERYMGLPSANPEGYDRTSVLKAADKLNGKLLLIHGAVDNNVHPQNSVRLIDALQKSGKQFRFMLYPQSQHGVTNPMRVKHMNQMVTDFILENL